MPNKENLRKWVAALRSGEYEQGSNNLNKEGRYCCLGVACEVAILNGVQVNKTYSGRHTIVIYDHDSAYLPGSVRGWLGVLSNNPTIDSGILASHANDNLGLTFNEIADRIERYYGLNDHSDESSTQA